MAGKRTPTRSTVEPRSGRIPSTLDPEATMSPASTAALDHSRPDLPDEDAEGQTELEAEMRRQAEQAGSHPIRRSETDEPAEAVTNQGEFPDMADQGETRMPKRRPVRGTTH